MLYQSVTVLAADTVEVAVRVEVVVTVIVCVPVVVCVAEAVAVPVSVAVCVSVAVAVAVAVWVSVTVMTPLFMARNPSPWPVDWPGSSALMQPPANDRSKTNADPNRVLMAVS